MKYKINLLDKLLKKERDSRAQKLRGLIYSVLSLGVLFLVLFQATLEVKSMVRVIDFEEAKLAKITAEYQKYKETIMVVNKSDIELLDRLQNNRIFWTKKLAVTAHYLPSDYWIEKLDFNKKLYNVNGYGYINPEQKQLITVDDYLNLLRVDSTFNDDFNLTYLNSIVRTDEKNGVERVMFEFSSQRGGGN
jgi:hypothetical protein